MKATLEGSVWLPGEMWTTVIHNRPCTQNRSRKKSFCCELNEPVALLGSLNGGMEKDELENQGWLNTSRATEKSTSAWLVILESYLSGTSWLPTPVPSDYLLFLYFGGRALPMLESCKLFWALQASRVLGGPLCPSGVNVSHWKEQRHHRSIQHPYPVTNRKLRQTWEITIFQTSYTRQGRITLPEGKGRMKKGAAWASALPTGTSWTSVWEFGNLTALKRQKTEVWELKPTLCKYLERKSRAGQRFQKPA